jgi:hypothetical protein
VREIFVTRHEIMPYLSSDVPINASPFHLVKIEAVHLNDLDHPTLQCFFRLLMRSKECRGDDCRPD